MPRIRKDAHINALAEEFKRTGDWSSLRKAQNLQQKYENAKIKRPDKIYHGSPYKLKKGTPIKARGPIFYGESKPAVAASRLFNEAKAYSRESDQGGVNKTRYGKKIEPKIFAQKGYVYEIHDHHKGWFKAYHGAADPNHWNSYHEQHWDKRHSVRYKGKLPITRHEAVIGGLGLAAVSGGGLYYYRRRRGKQERVRRNARAFHSTHAALSRTRARKRS